MHNRVVKYAYLLAIGAVLMTALGWWYFGSTESAPPPARVYETYVVPAAGEAYTNEAYDFSLTLPEGFLAREMPSDTGTIVLLEEQVPSLSYGRAGIQIAITPFEDDVRVLTEDMIHDDIPDMAIRDAQPVEIGDDHTGLAFMSDAAAFDGASREVWFVFRGNLYQISTYAHLDGLLQTLFNSWKFL